MIKLEEKRKLSFKKKGSKRGVLALRSTNSTVHVHITWSSNDQFPDTNPEPKASIGSDLYHRVAKGSWKSSGGQGCLSLGRTERVPFTWQCKDQGRGICLLHCYLIWWSILTIDPLEQSCVVLGTVVMHCVHALGGRPLMRELLLFLRPSDIYLTHNFR